MTSLCIIFSLLVIHLILALAGPVEPQDEKCKKLMKENGLTRRFPGAVAHGIHSITLEDIRYYFKASATEQNNVPTLNFNLSEKATPVLPHAKLYGYDTSFKTVSMRHLDQVLRDMDKKDWYLTNYNTLEKLVHTMHMGEVWAKAKVHYESIALLGYKKDLCACVKDTEKNGILKMLPYMSLKIRYPGITSGKVLEMDDGGIAMWAGNLYRYGFFNEWSSELAKFDFDDDMKVVKRKVAKELVDGDDGMTHLDGEKGWATWKEGMKSMIPHDDYELAMFLYCVLN